MGPVSSQESPKWKREVDQTDVMVEKDAREIGGVRGTQPTVVGFEDEGRGPEPGLRWPRGAGSGPQFAASKETVVLAPQLQGTATTEGAWEHLPPSTSRKGSAYSHLDLGSVRPARPAGRLAYGNCGMLNMCCVKPLSLC